MEIKKVGVVGSGIMGTGIAQVCAQLGYSVIVSGRREEGVSKGLASIDSRLSSRIERGRLSQQDKDAIMANIKTTISIKDFADCDLVIETVNEDLELKKKVFIDLDRVCPEGAILATNTSCLSIIDMAMATGRPDRVLGVHFMNPVPLMKLLEIVRTIETSEETLETGVDFGKSLEKTIIIAKDTPGFITNYLLMPFLLNAIRMLDSKVATKEDIDASISLGLNHPMGPLTLTDFIGLDTVFYITSAMYAEFKDPQYAPPTILKKMVVAGWLGRKSGKGFYDYNK